MHETINRPNTITILGKIKSIDEGAYTKVAVFDYNEYAIRTLTILPNWDIHIEEHKKYYLEIEYIKGGESYYMIDGEKRFYRYTAAYLRSAVPYSIEPTGKLTLK